MPTKQQMVQPDKETVGMRETFESEGFSLFLDRIEVKRFVGIEVKRFVGRLAERGK